MAIFYNHVKGCGANEGAWTWIQWSDNPETLPSIYSSRSNSLTGRTDCGTIITSAVSGQSITRAFTFTSALTVQSYLYPAAIEFIDPTTKQPTTAELYVDKAFNSLNIKYDENTINLMSNKLKVSGEAEFSKNIKSSGSINTDTQPIYTISGNIYSINGNIYTTKGKCEALYFNALSDKRAKENISIARFNALSTVKALPVYNFNYIARPQETTIGLIAQEAAIHNLDSFSLVDNLDATGHDNDFMSIKESKLVYVLWKAVQELSDEVDQLKQEIKNLTQK